MWCVRQLGWWKQCFCHILNYLHHFVFVYVCCNFNQTKEAYQILTDLTHKKYSGDCEHQRRWPASESAQADQRLCYSIVGMNHIYTCNKRNFHFLASHCSWGDWFETRFVGNPDDRFSRDEAHMSQSNAYSDQHMSRMLKNVHTVISKGARGLEFGLGP